MSAPDGQNISSERQEPTFYAMIPKMAIMDLTPYELTLYTVYKQTASDNGVCFKSNATLAKEAHMSVSRMKEARKTLETKGFIRVKYYEDEAGIINTPPDVTIIDIWGENHKRFASEGGRQKTTPRSLKNRGGSPKNTKEEPSKKTPLKKDIAPGGASSRPRNPMFDAIATVFGYSDVKKPTRSEGSLIGKVANELCEAGYQPEQVAVIYAYCKAQGWKDFSAAALAAHAGNAIRANGRGANPLAGFQEVD